VQVTAPPIEQPMVMIYPKEGSMVRNNIAGIVQATWVSEEEKEAANIWIDFLLEDEQQQAFMKTGFRPGTKLSLLDANSKINGKYGLETAPDTQILSPERIDPAVALAIEQSWQDVKRSAIVTFVVDTSGSMSGEKIKQAKEGIVRALDSMARNNQVGFLSFNSGLGSSVPVGPLSINRFTIANTVDKLTTSGYTELYNAIYTGISMTDSAQGETDAIRAVIVLTDGHANEGSIELDELIKMMSRNEVSISRFRGFEDDTVALEVGTGRQVNKKDIIGTGLAVSTKHPVQIFFIGIGDDADMEVGRMLAQATGAEFQGVADEDLAQLLEEFSKYF
jgi:Ca-activated chloride channel family protein